MLGTKREREREFHLTPALRGQVIKGQSINEGQVVSNGCGRGEEYSEAANGKIAFPRDECSCKMSITISCLE